MDRIYGFDRIFGLKEYVAWTDYVAWMEYVFGIERVICNYWLSFVDEILEVGLKVGIDSFYFSAILIEWELTMISSSK